MKLNQISFVRKHNEPMTYLKWNVTKLPKPSLSPIKALQKDIIKESRLHKIQSQSKSPKTYLAPSKDTRKKSKLFLSIKFKEVFVLQDGSSVSPGQKLKGFYYPITSENSRVSHLEEMKDFYDHCRKFFNKTEDFVSLFTYKGERLQCLHKTPIDCKAVIASQTDYFIGLSQENSYKNRPVTRSPVYRCPSDYSKHLDIGDRVNSCFELSLQKYNPLLDLSLPKIKAPKFHLKKLHFSNRLGGFEKLKYKLNTDIEKIEKVYAPIQNLGMAELKAKYKFSESKLHSLNAKFKTLVLLSCAINPGHRISSGISRKSFIEYNSTSEEQAYVLGRIFDTFDIDSGGTISWEEFMSAMSIMYCGSYEAKIDLFFSVYDLDKSGTLSYTEIRELCKAQLQAEPEDKFLEELSNNFASLIFDVTETPYDGGISSEKIKEIVKSNGDQSLIDMFCSFNFLKF